MGAALIACLAGSLFYIAAAGFETTQYIFTGMLASYAVLVRSAFAASPAESRRTSGRARFQA